MNVYATYISSQTLQQVTDQYIGTIFFVAPPATGGGGGHRDPAP